MAAHPRLDVHVAYCSLQGAQTGIDPDFGREIKWDIPLLDGYPWSHVQNRSVRPGLGRFWGLVNPGLWQMVTRGRYDAVILYTGYSYASFWIAVAAAKLSGAAVLFGTDASSNQPRKGSWWKLPFKSFVLSAIYRLADGKWAASSAGKEYLKTLKVPEREIGVVPLVVDNDWWSVRASKVDRVAQRWDWGIPESARVVLFCAKLQPWKGPMDLLRAFALADVPDAHLVFAGDGPLSASLLSETQSLGIPSRVHFLGFKNQTDLPAVYKSADLFVLPSRYDPCPAVVCEAMLCGLPVLLSDEIRGRFELIDPGQTGFIFRCGNIEGLATLLRKVLMDPQRLASMGLAAREIMNNCSPQTNVRDFVELLDRASQTRPLLARKNEA
jgi:glycosyltransferase involved in cell wall biosynthesis